MKDKEPRKTKTNAIKNAMLGLPIAGLFIAAPNPSRAELDGSTMDIPGITSQETEDPMGAICTFVAQRNDRKLVRGRIAIEDSLIDPERSDKRIELGPHHIVIFTENGKQVGYSGDEKALKPLGLTSKELLNEKLVFKKATGVAAVIRQMDCDPTVFSDDVFSKRPGKLPASEYTGLVKPSS